MGTARSCAVSLGAAQWAEWRPHSAPQVAESFSA